MSVIEKIYVADGPAPSEYSKRLDRWARQSSLHGIDISGRFYKFLGNYDADGVEVLKLAIKHYKSGNMKFGLSDITTGYWGQREKKLYGFFVHGDNTQDFWNHYDKIKDLVNTKNVKLASAILDNGLHL